MLCFASPALPLPEFIVCALEKVTPINQVRFLFFHLVIISITSFALFIVFFIFVVFRDSFLS